MSSAGVLFTSEKAGRKLIHELANPPRDIWLGRALYGSNGATGYPVSTSAATPRYYTDVSNARRVSNYSFALSLGSLVVGDVVVAQVMTEDNASNHRYPAPTISGTGAVTMTSRQDNSALNNQCGMALYTGTVSTAGTVTINFSGSGLATANPFMAELVVGIYPAVGGYYLPATPNSIQANVPNGAPQGTITTADANSIIQWSSGDWSAVDGANRVYLGTPVERGYAYVSGGATNYQATVPGTGASQTVGLSAPTGQNSTLHAVEIRKSVSTTVTFDAVGPSSAGASSTATTLTWAHTCTGASLLLVGVAVGEDTNDTASTTATYAGTAMTSIGKLFTNNDTAGYMQVFALANPTSGTNNVVITRAGGNGTVSLVGGSQSYKGSTGLGTVTSAYGFTSSPTVTVSSATGRRVAAFAACGSNITATSQTLRWSNNFNTASGAGNAMGADAPGAPSVTHTFSSGSDYWSVVAVDIQAASVGTPTPWQRNGTPATSTGGAGNPATVTVPAGTLSTDYGVFSVSGNTANAGAGTWSCSRAGVTFTQLIAAQNVNNTDINVVQATGLQPGDTVSFTPTVGANYRLDHTYFSVQMAAGNVATRGGVSQTTTTAPAATVTPGYVFPVCTTRTATAGNTISSVINANGRPTTMRNLDYTVASTPNTNFALYEFYEPTTIASATTFTDVYPTGNGVAYHLYPASSGGSYTGAATTSGSGGISGNGNPSTAGTINTSGSGTTSASGLPSTAGTINTSGSGTASASGIPATSGAVSTSGSGTAVATGVSSFSGSASTSGSGNAVATGVPSFSGSASTSGTGTAVSTGIPATSAAASTSGSGSASTSGTPSFSGSASTSGSGSASVSGAQAATGVASTSGSGGVSTSGTPALTGAVSTSGSGNAVTSGKPAISGVTSTFGSGTAVAFGAPAITGAANTSGSGNSTASGASATAGSISTSGAGTANASGVPAASNSANTSGTGSTSAVGASTSYTGSTSTSGTGTASATGTPAVSNTASTSGTGTASTSGTPSSTSIASTSATGTASVTGTPALSNWASTSGSGSTSTSGAATATGAAATTGTGTSATSGAASGAGTTSTSGTGTAFVGLPGPTVVYSNTFTGAATALGQVDPSNFTDPDSAFKLTGSYLQNGKKPASGIVSYVLCRSTPASVGSLQGCTLTTTPGNIGFSTLNGPVICASGPPASGEFSAYYGAAFDYNNHKWVIQGAGGILASSAATTDPTSGSWKMSIYLSALNTVVLEINDVIQVTYVDPAPLTGRYAGLRVRSSSNATNNQQITNFSESVNTPQVTTSGSANTSGSGAASASGTPVFAGSTNTSATGTASTSGTPAFAGSINTSGVGTASASGSGTGAGAAVASGSGTATTTGISSQTGSTNTSGSGTASTTGKPVASGTAATSGTGTTSATGSPAFTGSINTSGTGTASATGKPAEVGSAVTSGNGTASATGVPTVSNTTSTSGTGTVSTSGKPTASGSANTSGNGTLMGTGSPAAFGSASLMGTGTASASGSILTTSGIAATSGTGSLAGTGAPAAFGSASIIGTGTASATGTPYLRGAANTSGIGSLSTAGKPASRGSASTSGAGSIDAGGYARTTQNYGDLMVFI